MKQEKFDQILITKIFNVLLLVLNRIVSTISHWCSKVQWGHQRCPCTWYGSKFFHTIPASSVHIFCACVNPIVIPSLFMILLGSCESLSACNTVLLHIWIKIVFIPSNSTCACSSTWKELFCCTGLNDQSKSYGPAPLTPCCCIQSQ